MRRPIRMALVAICVAGGALVTATAGLFGLSILRPHGCGSHGCRRSAVREATLQTREGHRAVARFVAREGRCPTGEAELVGSGLLGSSRPDPWGRPLEYLCQPAEDFLIVVRSAGPDGRFETSDDIWPKSAAEL